MFNSKISYLALLGLTLHSNSTVHCSEFAMEINPQGQVGINIPGTDIHPKADLHVKGRAHIQDILNLSIRSTAPTDAQEGDLYLNTEGQMMLYFQSSWNLLATPTPIASGPQSFIHLKLNELSGTLASNENGPIFNGTLVGGMTFDSQSVSGIEGTAIQFNGNPDFIEVSDDDALTFNDGVSDQPFSVSTWINCSDTSATQGILSKATSHNQGEYYILLFRGNIYFRLVDNSNKSYIGVRTHITLQQDQWQHLVVTYDGSSTYSGLKIYLDGTEVATSATNSGSYTSMKNTNTPLFIGKRNVFFYGAIDEVRVFDQEIDVESIIKLMDES